MHGHNLPRILTLTGGLTAALIFGYVTHLLRLSPIVGYLLAGLAVGPYTPGYSADRHLAEQLAEVGVILLMFGVGVHFHLKDLWRVRTIAVPGAVAQSAVATVLGVALALAFGWTWEAGVIFGLSIAVASTVVLTRVLLDHKQLHTSTGHVAVGWLVVEDIFTVLIFVMLPVLLGDPAQAGNPNLLLAIGTSLLKVGALVAITLVLGGKSDSFRPLTDCHYEIARTLYPDGACSRPRGSDAVFQSF